MKFFLLNELRHYLVKYLRNSAVPNFWAANK